ncbi:MAG: sigma-70 family RNA polymerase sigma factor [Bacteroidota bacterium]
MADVRALAPAVVARAQAGDEAALTQLLSAIEPILRAFFVKRVGARSEVDDLIQNTLVRIHRGLPDLKDTARLKAFAMKAALFELQDLYRGRYGPKETVVAQENLPEPALKPQPSGLRIDLERALAQLSPKAQTILEMREYGYRYEEIAKAIGTSEAAVKMQVKRAFTKLRGLLGVLLAALGAVWT